MANQILPIANSLNPDSVIAETVFFVDVAFIRMTDLHFDELMSAVQAVGETMINILDVAPSKTGATLKCMLSDAISQYGYMSFALVYQTITNIMSMVSSSSAVNKLYGITVTQIYYTDDDNFPSTGSTLSDDLGSGTPTDSTSPNTIDKVKQSIGDTSNAVKKQIEDMFGKYSSTVTHTAFGIGAFVIVILIIVVIGLFALARVERA